MNPSATSTDIRRDLVTLLPKLRRFALALSGNAATADGLVEDVCARAIQKSHLWKGEGRLESWLFSLIRSASNEEPRRRGRPETQSREKPTETESKNSAPCRVLLRLPPGQASALLLVDGEGFDYPEAASILGIAPDVLSSNVCAARLALAALPPGLAERRA